MSLNNKHNVLVFPCGAENALEIYESLRYSIHVNIYGASSVEDYGRLKYEKYIGNLPNISDHKFDEEFEKLIKDNNIDIVFATHDTVQSYLSEKSDKFSCYIVNNDKLTTKISRSKYLTYQKFSNKSWIPHTYSTKGKINNWPVVCKPDFGQGAKGVTICKDEKQLSSAYEDTGKPILVEYLPGREITVDCFTDRNRKLLWIGPRSRENVKAGITMRSEKLKNTPEIEKIANDINEGLLFRGPWFFQLKEDQKGKWKLLEISCRMAGTMVAQRAWGINLALMTVQDYMDRDLVIIPNDYVRLIERSLISKYKLEYHFDKVFIDFDDTIIIDGKVVPIAVAFIFEMIKSDKEVILITRHEYDIYKTLDDVGLSHKIFSKILHINNEESKSDYITNNSIFIDNHFVERYEVHRKHNIPVFDVEALGYFVR